ncbi:hypothetical protein GQ457_07G009130 [Hibiscus cannabinus]
MSGVKNDEVIEEGVDQVVGLRWAAVIEEMLGTTHELCGLVGDTTRAATYPFHSEDLEVTPNQLVGFRLREASNGNKVLISGPEGLAIGYATYCPIHSEDLDVVSPKQPVGSKVGEGSDTNNGKITEIMDRPRVNLKKTIESKKSRRVIRFGSLWDLQDKALTDVEQKRKERACKMYKLSKKSMEVSEILG